MSPLAVEYEAPRRTAEALADLGRLLSSTLDRDLVAERVTEAVRALLGARFSVVYRLVQEAGSLVALAVAGDSGPFTRGSVVGPGEGVTGLAVRERGPIVSPDVLADSRVTLTPDIRAGLEAAGVRAVLAVPMIVHDRAIGALAVGDHAGRQFTEEEARLAQAFADQAALALEMAHLYEAAERGRREAEAAERRAAFLNETARVLGSSLDYETTLGRVARLVVPDLADLCAVDVREPSGSIRRVAAISIGPANAQLAREFQARYPSETDAGSGALNVLRTGRSEFYPLVSEELLTTMARDGEHLQVLKALGVQSVMVVPLTAGGRILGAITLGTAESGRHYTLTDLSFAEELARRAGQAIDNAQLYRQAHDANRAKDEFLATVSHELRTPLTAILGWARVLRARAFDPDMCQQAMETIERNARAQTQIVDDLLDVSRIITGKLRLSVRPLDLVEVIQQAVEAVRPAIDAKGIHLRLALEEGARAFVGDPDRLQQVFWNLFSNAVKFTPREGEIEVVLRRAESQTEISVRDTGRGIRPEFLPYAFDRFRQAESATTRSTSGLGLGLAIVRHIVELHGGTVHVESAGEGRGATFTLRLPFASMLPRAASPTAAPAAARSEAAMATALRGLDVLLVEDETDARELLHTILEGAGARVTAVDSAAAADAALASHHFGVLVCDIAMPGEDGYGLVRRLRGRGERLPAVSVTALARPEDRARALQAGFDRHLSKPVDPPVLVAAVAEVARPSAAA